MSNNRITPFVKRLRVNGGTIYTFSSAVEDIGINISERKNDVAIKHFALLNIPSIYNVATDISVNKNRFNVIDILGAFNYEKNAPNIKDGRVLIAESFENYALNFEANLLNQTTYNPALLKTVSERVFWKWLKEAGAIRWTWDSSVSYFIEEPELNGYSNVVKYVGLSTTGNLRTDTFGTFNETYLQVPTSHGQTHVFWENISDENYYYGMNISGGATSILGRESYVNPHPDGLSLNAYYDIMDSSTQINVYGGDTYELYYLDDASEYQSGWWFTDEGLYNPGNNCYIIDSSNYTIGDYNTQLRYEGTAPVEFLRSKIDCLSVINNINDLTTAYNSLYGGITDLSYDDMAITYAVNDEFYFNAVLIYYDVYNKTGNLDTTTIPLAVNLLGILFLDAPATVGDVITIPSLEKIQSTSYGFGNSYSFRINIKSDNMVDDTAGMIVDMATSDQTLLDDFSNLYSELHNAVEILMNQTNLINNISSQYTSINTQYLNVLNRYGQVITVTGNNLSINGYGIYSSTTNLNNVTTLNFKTLVEGAGIYITDNGDYLTIDASLNLKDTSLGDIYTKIYELQEADVSLYNLILNVSSNLYSVINNVSTNLYNYKLEIISKGYVQEGSLGPTFIYANSSWGVVGSGATGDVTKAYVDASLGQYVKHASMGYGLTFNYSTTKQWEITDYVSKTYVDGSLNVKTSKTYVDGSLGNFIRSSSLGDTLWWNSEVFDVDPNYIHDSSLSVQFTWVGGYLTVDATLAGANPAGSTGDIQYNNAGVFGADSAFRFEFDTSCLTLGTQQYNIGIGVDVLKRNTSPGGGNIALGYQVLFKNTEGYGNVGIGTSALYNSSSGSYSIGIGHEAAYNFIDGSDNITLGHQSMYSSTDPIRNIAIGNLSLYSNTKGQDNIVIGNRAFYLNEGSKNVIIGNNAMNYSLATYRNIAIGYNAGNYNHAIFKADDRLVIANSSTNSPLIYGEFDKSWLIINGSMGIGKDFCPDFTSGSAALATLDIHGNLRCTDLEEASNATMGVVWNGTSKIFEYVTYWSPANYIDYIDGSLNKRDISINYLNTAKSNISYVQSDFVMNASMGDGLTWDRTSTKWDLTVPLQKLESGLIGAGVNDIDSYAKGDYNYAFYFYILKNQAGTSLRTGTLLVVNDGSSTTNYTDNSTADIGSTAPVVLSAATSGLLIKIRATISSGNWYITLIKMQV
jgi:hypothetical protein